MKTRRQGRAPHPDDIRVTPSSMASSEDDIQDAIEYLTVAGVVIPATSTLNDKDKRNKLLEYVYYEAVRNAVLTNEVRTRLKELEQGYRDLRAGLANLKRSTKTPTTKSYGVQMSKMIPKPGDGGIITKAFTLLWERFTKSGHTDPAKGDPKVKQFWTVALGHHILTINDLDDFELRCRNIVKADGGLPSVLSDAILDMFDKHLNANPMSPKDDDRQKEIAEVTDYLMENGWWYTMGETNPTDAGDLSAAEILSILYRRVIDRLSIEAKTNLDASVLQLLEKCDEGYSALVKKLDESHIPLAHGGLSYLTAFFIDGLFETNGPPVVVVRAFADEKQFIEHSLQEAPNIFHATQLWMVAVYTNLLSKERFFRVMEENIKLVDADKTIPANLRQQFLDTFEPDLPGVVHQPHEEAPPPRPLAEGSSLDGDIVDLRQRIVDILRDQLYRPAQANHGLIKINWNDAVTRVETLFSHDRANAFIGILIGNRGAMFREEPDIVQRYGKLVDALHEFGLKVVDDGRPYPHLDGIDFYLNLFIEFGNVAAAIETFLKRHAGLLNADEWREIEEGRQVELAYLHNLLETVSTPLPAGAPRPWYGTCLVCGHPATHLAAGVGTLAEARTMVATVPRSDLLLLCGSAECLGALEGE